MDADQLYLLLVGRGLNFSLGHGKYEICNDSQVKILASNSIKCICIPLKSLKDAKRDKIH